MMDLESLIKANKDRAEEMKALKEKEQKKKELDNQLNVWHYWDETYE